MPLLSIEFAVFFLCFFPLYWLLRASPRGQNYLLLAAGLGWLFHLHWGFAAAVVVFSLAVTVAAAGLSQAVRPRARQGWLAGGVGLALVNLAFFKYFDFFRPALQQWLHGPVADLLLPLGISYYTFQAVAYLVSLYRREDVKLKWRDLLLHLSFFPTITSGPIARAGYLKSLEGTHPGMAGQIQTDTPRRILYPALAVSLVVLGITKKWWLAGSLAGGWVDPVFENPMQYDALAVLTAMYGYTVQLFLDFSGYTDLVIGMAMLLGFRLPQNFMMPLRAFNIRDFWDRWHITLSTWIRDYIYIPLGGSRHGFVRTQFNLMAAMLLSGIWHGQGWNFLLWGFLHGAALVLLNIGDRIAGKREWLASSSRWGKALGVLVTVNFVCFAFVVFRTASLEEAGLMFRALLGNELGWRPADLGTVAVLALMVLALLFYGSLARLFQGAVRLLERLPLWLWPLPLAAALWLLMVLAPSGIPGFIYANF
ncbi:MBOAT family O-acyltransferase [Neisseria shayeganii]|uniref:Probable alginate O-acetylase AlgI n=1 Tax=Neisseria shayeganii TaxID=607712 RepID=A0A7D7NB94_9NEIS|nr:MBOAT family protein [Neisseria shayeganii]QMT40415.1 MBOAT family protein [Neisseria shayeganii]